MTLTGCPSYADDIHAQNVPVTYSQTSTKTNYIGTLINCLPPPPLQKWTPTVIIKLSPWDVPTVSLLSLSFALTPRPLCDSIPIPGRASGNKFTDSSVLHTKEAHNLSLPNIRAINMSILSLSCSRKVLVGKSLLQWVNLYNDNE